MKSSLGSWLAVRLGGSLILGLGKMVRYGSGFVCVIAIMTSDVIVPVVGLEHLVLRVRQVREMEVSMEEIATERLMVKLVILRLAAIAMDFRIVIHGLGVVRLLIYKSMILDNIGDRVFVLGVVLT